MDSSDDKLVSLIKENITDDTRLRAPKDVINSALNYMKHCVVEYSPMPSINVQGNLGQDQTLLENLIKQLVRVRDGHHHRRIEFNDVIYGLALLNEWDNGRMRVVEQIKPYIRAGVVFKEDRMIDSIGSGVGMLYYLGLIAFRMAREDESSEAKGGLKPNRLIGVSFYEIFKLANDTAIKYGNRTPDVTVAVISGLSGIANIPYYKGLLRSKAGVQKLQELFKSNRERLNADDFINWVSNLYKESGSLNELIPYRTTH